MGFALRSKSGMAAFGAASVLGLFVCLTNLPAPAQAQGLTGRWVATGKTMENGEVQRTILELSQTGSDLSGKLVALEYGVDVKGTATGSHFELFAVGWTDKKPFIVGDLSNGELHGTEWGSAFVAKPATPADERPKQQPYLEPPPLHKVPYNGLAKTPPMGWNSWNFLRRRWTTRPCAPWPTRWYRAECAMPGTSTSTSMTPGKACAMRRGICNRITNSPT